MSTPISPTLRAWKNADSRNSPLILLYDIEITDEITMRLVAGDPMRGPVTYDGHEYSPSLIEMEEAVQSIEGELSQCALHVSNVTGVAGGYLERYDLEGRTVTVTRVLAATLLPADAMVETYSILSQRYDRKTATVTLGPPNLFKRNVPWKRFLRRCSQDWENRFQPGNGCAYPSDEFEVDSAGTWADREGVLDKNYAQHGWHTVNLGKCTRVDVDITYPGCLFIESRSSNIEWAGTLGAPYVYKQMTGDFDVSTNVDIYDSRIGSLAGLMVQEDTGNYDSWVAVGRAQDADGNLFIRSPAAEHGLSEPDVASSSDAPYVRLERVGGAITCYYSSDGVTWTLLAERTITLDTNCRVGLFLSAPPVETSLVSVAFPWIRFTAGGSAVCERSLEYCRLLGNTRRIFAFPGMPRK